MRVFKIDFIDRSNFYEVIDRLPGIDSEVIFEQRHGSYVLSGRYDERGFIDDTGKIYCKYLDVCRWGYKGQSSSI